MEPEEIMKRDDLNHKCNKLLEAARKYYQPVGDEQSPLEDWQYEELKNELLEHWDELSEEWKTILGPKEDLKYTTMHVL